MTGAQGSRARFVCPLGQIPSHAGAFLRAFWPAPSSVQYSPAMGGGKPPWTEVTLDRRDPRIMHGGCTHKMRKNCESSFPFRKVGERREKGRNRHSTIDILDFANIFRHDKPAGARLRLDGERLQCSRRGGDESARCLEENGAPPWDALRQDGLRRTAETIQTGERL